MKYALYTGCVAKSAAKELLVSTYEVCAKLGIELAEMKDASCCGAGVLGEDNPIVENDSPENRATNERIMIVPVGAIELEAMELESPEGNDGQENNDE